MLIFLYYFNLKISYTYQSHQFYDGRRKVAVQVMQLITARNLFPLEVVHKWQHCQHFVFWKNAGTILCAYEENFNKE